MPETRQIFVLDTNILVDYPDIITDDPEYAKPEEASINLEVAHIVVPTAVIRELSSFKKEQYSNRGKSARSILKRIRKLVEGAGHTMEEVYSMKKVIEMPNGTQTLSILPIRKDFTKDLPFKPSDSDMDGQMILAALTAAKCFEDDSIVLLTNDNGLAIRAYARGVITASYSYKMPPQYTGRRNVEIPPELFSQFYNEHRIALEEWQEAMPNEPALIANEFLIFTTTKYPKDYDLKDDEYFRHIGRYDAGNKEIVPLRYVSNFPCDVKNVGQAIYAEALSDPNIDVVLCTGPAGSGKTYMATIYAYNACKAGQYIGTTIVPCQPQKDRVGFLPGDLNEKLDPNVQPIKNAIRNYLLKTDKDIRKQLDNMQKFGANEAGKNPGKRDSSEQSQKSIKAKLDEHVELIWSNWFGKPIPIDYARGRDFAHEIAIYDEFQDQSRTEADTLIKRPGEGGKAIVCGDVEQLHNVYLDRENNGLVYISELIKDLPMVAQVTFTEEEVVRHPFVRAITQRQKASKNPPQG